MPKSPLIQPFIHIIPRKIAIEYGLKKYFTGKSCKHGHICERYTKGGCIQCTDLTNRDKKYSNPENYNKMLKRLREKWANEGRDKYLENKNAKRKKAIKEFEDKYKVRCVSQKEAKEQGLLYYQTHKKCKYDHVSPRYVKHGNCVACFRSDKKRKKSRIYRQNNRQKIRQWDSERRSKKRLSSLVYGPEDVPRMEAIVERADILSRFLGLKFEIDHIIPINGKLVCGLHCSYNLRPLPMHENSKKFNHFDIDDPDYTKSVWTVFAKNLGFN